MRTRDCSSDVCSSDLSENHSRRLFQPRMLGIRHDADGDDGGSVSADRGQRANLLSVAQRIWRPEDRSGATDEGPGEGEPAASPCDIGPDAGQADIAGRSEEHTSELQSLMRISYAVFCLKKKTYNKNEQIQLQSDIDN